MINQLTVGQMIANIGMPGPAEFSDSNKLPHPASLDSKNPALQELCKLSAEEQIWQVEERRFEQKLERHIQKLHLVSQKSGAPLSADGLDAIAKRHRRQWRERRRGHEPASVKKQNENYDQFDRQLERPNWQDTGT